MVFLSLQRMPRASASTTTLLWEHSQSTGISILTAALSFSFHKEDSSKSKPVAFFTGLLLFTNCCSCTRGSEMRPFSHSNPLAQMGKRTQWLKEKGWVVAKLQLPHTTFVQPSQLSQTMLLFCKPCPYISLLSFVMLWKNKLFPLSARKKIFY